MPTRWVALTGTPGVGKTTLARALRKAGVAVVDGKRFAIREGCVTGLDRSRNSKIVDLKKVGARLKRTHSDEKLRVLESHWAHEVPGMDAAVVLRLRPKLLLTRLRRRRWSDAKVRENLEAEALGIISAEARKAIPKRRILELDMTGVSTSVAAGRVTRFLRDGARRAPNVEIAKVDWTEDILGWF